MSEIHFRSHFWPFQINIQFIYFLEFFDIMAAISCHFRSIGNFYLFLIFFLQNGRWRTFWMFENYFRWHFWPFQIHQPFWMSEIHFQSHFWPFQIDTKTYYYTSDGNTLFWLVDWRVITYAIFPLRHFIRQQYSLYCPVGYIRSSILAGNIASDCGPLGRHNRAAMFRACSVTIIIMSQSTSWQLVSANSLIHAKSYK